MRALGGRPFSTPRGPAPTRFSYRLERLLMKRWVRLALRRGLPLALIAGGAGAFFADDARRADIALMADDIRASIAERPEFEVHMMAIDGVSEAVAAEIRTVLPIEFPISSFYLDLEEARDTVAALNAVSDVSVRIRTGGILQIVAAERVPVAIWRDRDGLRLVDADGVFVASVAARADRPDLPLVVGDGALDAVGEALALYALAEPISERLRGLVRMGERRWDVVLDNDQRILLPEEDPLGAFARVISLHQTPDMRLLDRDITTVDLRLPERMTVRLGPVAAARLSPVTASTEDSP